MGIIDKNADTIKKIPGGSIILTTADAFFNTARKSSLFYLLFGLACCALEMMAVGASRYDLDRLGMIFRATPRQADLMFIAGTLTLKMAPRVKLLYDQMPEPKYVIAVGGCAINGGPFYYDTYSVLKGVDKIIPVDVYIPGCPPRPEAFIHGIQHLQEKIKRTKMAG